MSDYLNSLVSRTLGLAPVVQPRPASLFEPVAAGPVTEAAFAVAETHGTQEIASRSERMAAELTDTRLQTEQTSANEPPHAVRQSQTMPINVPVAVPVPTQVMPPSPFSMNAIETPGEIRDQKLSSRPAETDSIMSASETRHQPTPSLIRPEVRIVSSATDREPVQPSLTTPPLTPVLSNSTRPDSLSRTRGINAQAGDAAAAPETVVVTIGRVDVRAIFAPPQAAPRANRTQPQPLSLDEYLKQRSEGHR